MTSSSSPDDNQQRHEAVVLFYRYLDPKASRACRLLHNNQHSEFYLNQIYQFQKEICTKLGLKGRILLAPEGINGTLSGASVSVLHEYRQAMETFDLIQQSSADAAYPPGDDDDVRSPDVDQNNDDDDDDDDDNNPFIFAGIDWKESFLHSSSSSQTTTTITTEPFPNLKISIVKELVSSGGAISVEDLEDYGGTHLTPEEFHAKILGDDNAQTCSSQQAKDVVLIDVRNTFEHAIGHFVNPHTDEAAMNPEMVTFSSFDPKFCQQHASSLKDKTVLMYCTGGIRCEKASAMLKKRGVENVYQLQGGIHRYLETYGESGCFRGRNFQFDQRVSLTPAEHYHHQARRRLALDDDDATAPMDSDKNVDEHDDHHHNAEKEEDDIKTQPHQVVGKCMQCHVTDFDELSGSRICTVCRDLVLVCPSCQDTLREYHCRRHADWKLYFTFLEVFDKTELEEQKASMESLLEHRPEYSKQVRKTLRKQIEKLRQRLEDIEKNPELVNPNAPRRCRSCREPHGTVCNGYCWGFWKTAGVSQPKSSHSQSTEMLGDAAAAATSTDNDDDEVEEPILSICVGDMVRPGPHWNDYRYGNPLHPKTGEFLEGTVAELKSWGTGSTELDCVAVEWNDPDHLPRRRQVQIYRWGAKAVNGSRLYDVARA